MDKGKGEAVGYFHFRKMSLAAVCRMDCWGPGVEDALEMAFGMRVGDVESGHWK